MVADYLHATGLSINPDDAQDPTDLDEVAQNVADTAMGSMIICLQVEVVEFKFDYLALKITLFSDEPECGDLRDFEPVFEFNAAELKAVGTNIVTDRGISAAWP